MAEGCAGGCAKMLLIIFNYIFWMSGLAIIGIGIWFLVDPDFEPFFDIQEATVSERPLLKYGAFILIGVGILVFLVGFIGCCGAIKENRCLLGLYIFFMFIVMAGELAAGIYVLVNRSRVKQELLDTWQVAIKEKYKQDSEEGKIFTDAQDILQVERRCCGVNQGPPDYQNSTWRAENPSMVVPYSCCVLKEGVNTKKALKEEDVLDNDKCQQLESEGSTIHVYKKNCYDAVIEWLESNATIMIGVAIGIAGLELFGFIFAIILCRNAK